MVDLVYQCKHCGAGFRDEKEALDHEEIEITYDAFQKGYCFRDNRDELRSNYYVTAGKGPVNHEHVRMYAFITIPGMKLFFPEVAKAGEEKSGVDVVHVPGDLPIEDITDEEFNKVQPRLEEKMGMLLRQYKVTRLTNHFLHRIAF